MHPKHVGPALILLFAVLFSGASAKAQTAFGPIHLVVDATRAPQKILHAQMQMPVHAGALSLYYPEWIPGEHMPDGPIINVAGLKFTANGRTIPWRRDLVEMFTIHLDIPAGVTSLDADFDFLLSSPVSGFSAGSSATGFLDVLSWNQVLLYPKGYTITTSHLIRAYVFRQAGNSAPPCPLQNKMETASNSRRSLSTSSWIHP